MAKQADELTDIRDIIASAGMGIWHIELIDGQPPRMYADSTMKELMGLDGRELTPEETYTHWYSRIKPEAVASVLESVGKMQRGRKDENTYLWLHPAKGERYVRCGGTAEKVPGGFVLRGYHYDVDAQVREEQKQQEKLSRALAAARAANQEKDAIHLALGSGDWSMSFDERGEMTACTWSRRFREMLGYTSVTDFPDELASWSDLLHPEDRQRVLDHYWDVVRDYTGQKTYDIYYRLMTRARGERWFRAIGRLTRREDGSPVTFYGIFLDVDDDRRDHLKHETETTDLIKALSSVYIDVILADMARGTAKPVKLDPLARRLDNGYFALQDRPYSMAEYADNHVHPEDRSRFAPIRTMEDCRRYFADHSELSFNYRSQGNGATHYMQLQAVRPAADGSEFVLGFRNVDAEEAQRLERLRQEHEVLGIIEALSTEYVLLALINAAERTYRTIRTNGTGDAITAKHKDPEAALYRYVDTWVAPEDRDRMREACTLSHMEANVPRTGLYSVNFLRQNDGDTLHYQMNVARFTAGDGNGYFVIGFRDITASVEKELMTQKALQEAYDVAEAANHAKSDFLQTMSHDIRTPMNGIIGMTAIAAAHIDDRERVQDSLRKITQASKHLLSLINEVLDMSKIESGKVSLTEEEFNLSELIDNLVTMVRPQALAHRHELSVNIRKVTHEKVIGDPSRVQQVFVNMMSNAIKYTPDGGKISLGIREIPCRQQKTACYEFTFADNGIGMDEKFVSQIFEPFSRAEDGRISKIQGTGLGMPISRNIVRMMGGDITIHSRLNEGSTFIVTIYLRLQDADEASDGRFIDLPVLVADDDELCMESAVEILEELGMKADGVLSGGDALDHVVKRHRGHSDYYAVILDWKMPGMDGVETARAIRREVGEGVPIIILSSYDMSEIEEEARRAGVNAFINKPLFKSRLVRVFNEVMGTA